MDSDKCFLSEKFQFLMNASTKHKSIQELLAVLDQDDLFFSTIIIPNGDCISVVEKLFRRYQRCVMTKILTVSEWLNTIYEKPTEVSQMQLFLSLYQEIKNNSNTKNAISLTKTLVESYNFCKNFGYEIKDNHYTRILKNIVDTYCVSIKYIKIKIETFLDQNSKEFFFFLDLRPTMSSPLTDLFRDIFSSRKCLFKLDSEATPRTPFYKECQDITTETCFISQKIAEIIHNSPEYRISIISDNQFITQKIMAELLERSIEYQQQAVCLSNTTIGGLIYDVAVWISNPSAEHMYKMLINSALNKQHIYKFAQKIVYAPSKIFDNDVIIPAKARFNDVRNIIQLSEDRDLHELLDKFPKIHFNEQQFLSEFMTLHEQILSALCNDQGCVHEFFNEIKFYKDFLLTSNEYAQLTAGLLANCLKTLRITPSKVSFLTTRQALSFEYDFAFLPGMNESEWFFKTKIPQFVECLENFDNDLEELIFKTVIKKSTYITRTISADISKNIHRFLFKNFTYHDAQQITFNDGCQPSTNHTTTNNTPNRIHYASATKDADEAAAFVAVSDRPHTLAITDVQLLCDDAYAFYVKKILKLHYNQPSNLVADYGLFVHYVLHHYFADGFFDKKISLVDFVKKTFDHASTLVRKVFLPKLLPVLKNLDKDLTNKRETITKIQTELRLSMSFFIHDKKYDIYGFADRVDFCEDQNTVTIMDYKTGTLSSEKSIKQLEIIQLPLEAMMLYDKYQNIDMELIHLKYEYRQQPSIKIHASETFIIAINQKINDILSNYQDPSFIFSTKSSELKQHHRHLSRINHIDI
jgi:uncharacterized protein YlzI (FlbEa/FlbD family)